MNNPLISVCTITYMHEEYIADTIEGVLMQETEFPIEFVIADDNSPDRTEKVVLDCINNHPRGHLIKYTRHSVNKGMNSNFIWALKQCKGKYIAVCEGDDYWIDPLKLQKQVEFLEKNPDYIICGHNTSALKEGSLRERIKELADGNFESVLLNGLSQDTLSVMFRNELKTIPGWYYKCLMGDYPLYLLLLENGGKVKYLKDLMGVYRHHDGGIWSSMDKTMTGEKVIKSIEIIDKGFGNKYSKLFQKAKVNMKWRYGLLDFTLSAVLKGQTPLRLYLIKKRMKIKNLLDAYLNCSF